MKMQTPTTTEPKTDRKSIWVFTPSRTEPKDLETILVQRQKLLQDAVERVKESALTDHKHHLLFVGPRGCGKTHLVTLVVSRLTEDDELTDRLRIAWLNEDETCTTLLEFLLKIQAALEKRYPEEFSGEVLTAAYDMKQGAALDFVSSHLLSVLGSRTLLVVTENLDALFEGLGNAGQKKLRSFIQENPKLSIVATAQRLVEDLSSRNSPFFGFFQTEHLKPLNVEQATELLKNIASLQERHDVVEFLDTSRGRSRVRAIHHLSGGNHRIYIVLSQFITRDTVDALLEPFMKMVDELTPYYQERIRWLPPMQRKIVEHLCICESTVPVKEIAKRLFASSQTISNQLQALREKGYVEAHQRGRESLYEISEPLMRICVEVKDNQRHQPLRLLVDFLRVWYDDHELKNRLGKMESPSYARAYLESAIQRNSAEGNLRKQILLSDFQSSLLEKLPLAILDGMMQQLKNEPEEMVLAMQSMLEGKPADAIRCVDEALGDEIAPAAKAELLLIRAQLYASLNEPAKGIADYTTAIELPGAPIKQVAEAFLARGLAHGLAHGQEGDAAREIADFTAVIELPGASVELVAMVLFIRGFSHDRAGDALRAIADYTAVVELPGAPVKLVAYALVIRGLAYSQTGDAQRAIADYTAVIELPSAPVEPVAMAYICRGLANGLAGEAQCAVADYTAVIELPSAPVEQVVMAYLSRGLAHGKVGDAQRAIADYTAVIELPGASVERVIMARVCRGLVHGQVGDTQRAAADCTAVIELPGAPVEQVALALFSRGLIHDRAGDEQCAVADYTAVIDLPGAPAEQVAKALLSRGLAYGQAGDAQRKIADYTAVIALPDAPAELVAKALYSRGVVHFKKSRRQESKEDFEALIRLPAAPLEKVVDAQLALSELHFSEGRWSAGFLALRASLKSGAQTQPPYRGAATDLVGAVFSAGLNSDGRLDKISGLLHAYNGHNALSVLGEAVVQHIGRVFRAGEPFPSADNLDGWGSGWEQAAEKVPDFRLSVRLLRTGIDFVKAGGKDHGVLRTLTSPERVILEQALGLANTSDAKTT